MNQKRRRKNKNKSILYLLLLAILTCIAISGTFARYTTSQTGTGEVVVAKWSFNVDGLDGTSLVRTTMTDTIVDGRLAPGTEGYLPIEIDATGTEVALDYEIEITDVTNKPENLKFYSDEDYKTELQGVEKEVTNEDGTPTTQITYILKGHMTLAQVLDESTAKRTVKMYWKWPYETVGGDEQDTADGLIGDMEFTVKVVGSQSIKDASEGTKYTITYNLNNGTGDIPSQTKQEGIDVAITSEAPSRTGYTFKGWATTSEAIEATYVAGDKFAVDANTTLYAVWEAETYTVTYNYAYNGGTSATVQTAQVAYDDFVYLTPTATKAGYDFVGWTRSQTDVTPEKTIKMEPNDLTLYAIYSKEVTISYDCLEETATDTIYNNQTESRMTVTSTVPEKASYIFENWNTKQDGTGTSYESGASYTSIESATLYVQWEEAVATTSTKGYTSLAKAIEGAAETDKVTMLANSKETETATVASGKNITLDLGGKTVSYSGINGINNAGTLTVVGSGKITDTAARTIENTGTLNINMTDETSYNNGTGGIIENTSGQNAPRAIHNNGIVNLNSGIVANSATAEAVTAAQTPKVQTPFALVNGYNGTLNINGGIIRSISSNIYPQSGLYSTGILNMSGGLVEAVATTMTITDAGNATITGGTINAGGTDTTKTGVGTAIVHSSTGTTKISNSSVKVTGLYRDINNYSTGEVIISGGTYTHTSTLSGQCIYNHAGGKITIEGGTFTSDSGSSCAYNNAGGIIEINGGILSSGSGITNNGTGEIIIKNGTINGTQTQAILTNSTGTVTISDGTITGKTLRYIHGNYISTNDKYKWRKDNRLNIKHFFKHIKFNYKYFRRKYLWSSS